MSKRLALSGLAVVLTLGLVAGFLADFTASEVPEAYATACQPANGSCGGGDTTKTSAMHVTHYTTAQVNAMPVEPDSGESWTVKAYWNTAGPTCYEYTEEATVDVDWNGSAWVLSNESTTTNIIDIDICSTADGCTGEDTHSYGYKLIADITDPVTVGFNNYHLRRVDYIVSDVDDGYELDTSTCTLGTAVSFADTMDGGTDNGPFTVVGGRCTFDCTISGGTAVIKYE